MERSPGFFPEKEDPVFRQTNLGAKTTHLQYCSEATGSNNHERQHNSSPFLYVHSRSESALGFKNLARLDQALTKRFQNYQSSQHNVDGYQRDGVQLEIGRGRPCGPLQQRHLRWQARHRCRDHRPQEGAQYSIRRRKISHLHSSRCSLMDQPPSPNPSSLVTLPPFAICPSPLQS